MPSSTASAVIIGNEVLSAKVNEENGAFLIRRLKEKGLLLKWMAFVPDEIDAIVEALAIARQRADFVITSGGIGPTHDDVTVRAVALALGREVIRLPEMVKRVQEHYSGNMPPEALRLAEAPSGSQLLFQDGLWYPVLVCDGVYMLPGVPQLFRLQLEAVLSRWEGKPLALQCLYLSRPEADIARVLDEVALAMPEVAIGSYPTFDKALGYKVKVTVEHEDAAQVARAVASLVAQLPPGSIVRVD